MSSTHLYTMGYQGRSLSSLIEILRSKDIQMVVDVRQLPLSRMRGFSKTALSLALESAGIGYASIPQLGTPRDLRREYRRTRDWALLARKFNSFLDTRQEQLDGLTARACLGTVCLLCFERDSSLCHRSIVAAAIRERSANGLQITNL